MSRSRNDAIMKALATLLGGVGGALVSGLLVRLGVRPMVARTGVVVAGGAGAAMLSERLACASGGAAAAGVSQLALAFLEAERSAIEAEGRALTESAGSASDSGTERNADPSDVDDEELEEELANIDDEELAILRAELGEPQLMVRFRNGAPEPRKMPAWLPGVALVGMAFLPLFLQRIAD